MKKAIYLFVSLLTLILSTAVFAAEQSNKIAVVDVQKALENSYHWQELTTIALPVKTL